VVGLDAAGDVSLMDKVLAVEHESVGRAWDVLVPRRIAPAPPWARGRGGARGERRQHGVHAGVCEGRKAVSALAVVVVQIVMAVLVAAVDFVGGVGDGGDVGGKGVVLRDSGGLSSRGDCALSVSEG